MDVCPVFQLAEKISSSVPESINVSHFQLSVTMSLTAQMDQTKRTVVSIPGPFKVTKCSYENAQVVTW